MDPETGESLIKLNESAPPPFFQHEELINNLDTAKPLDQTELINTLNYLHFTGRPLFVLLQHPVYQDKIIARAHPEPCLDNQFTFRWDESYFKYKLDSYKLIYLIIINNQFVIAAPINILSVFKTGLTINLPEKSFVLNSRRIERHTSKSVYAELMQSDFLGRGELIDFSSEAFRIRADSETFKHNNWFNPDVPASVRLFSGNRIIYSEFCKCIRYEENLNIPKEIVFAAESRHISRFLAKKIRNPRKHISQPIAAVFEHPLLKKKIHRDIFDISTTGFSITVKPDDDLIMPGLIISDLSIIIAGIPIATCTVQIIYKRIRENNARYGIAILDTDIHSYSRINHLLGINLDPQISVSMEVDMDALWEFFFQTGFIYPEKYRFCVDHRETFIKTYRKLYQENPDIARHITYEKNGRIYGHISMVRAYERTWLIQHHAARSMENQKLPGFAILRQMMFFTHGMYQLPSSRMDYVISYFRPENKFPDRIFGGFARDFNNPQACSLDLFSYLTIPISATEEQLPEGWFIRESLPADLWELSQFYKHRSGGLLLNIFDCGKYDSGDKSLENTFKCLGFFRTWRIYSLIYNDDLKAVFIVDQSDPAINMSNLLNCIKIIITDPAGLPMELTRLAVSKLGKVYNLDKITLLIYPDSGIRSDGISYKKHYQLWIGDMRYMNQFMDYVQEKFRMNYD